MLIFFGVHPQSSGDSQRRQSRRAESIKKRIASRLICAGTLIVVPTLLASDSLDEQLLDAVREDRNDDVRQLLDAGADVNVRKGGRTALHVAAATNNIEMAGVLLDAGADVNSIDTGRGWFVLHQAAEQNNTEMVRLLLDAGAVVHALNDSGETALHVAAARNNIEMADLLLGARVNVNAQARTEFLARATALHVAVDESDTEMARLLLDWRADTSVLDEYGGTVLTNAVRHNDAEMVQVLLDAGTDANIRDGNGSTALHAAVYESDTEMARLLLDWRADASVLDENGWTVLANAAWHNDAEMVQILLDAGTDVNIRDSDGLTALQYAVAAGNTGIAQLLLDAGADIADTLEMLAYLDPEEEILRLLLGGNANLDAQDFVWKRFELYSGCEPMRISVGFQNNSDEVVPSLTEEAIQAAVESRLRTARLYDSEASSRFSVYVHLIGSDVLAYTTEASFNKSVSDRASGHSRFAPTWERRALGTAPESAVGEAILGKIRRYMDEFLTEYLRVNETVCE